MTVILIIEGLILWMIIQNGFLPLIHWHSGNCQIVSCKSETPLCSDITCSDIIVAVYALVLDNSTSQYEVTYEFENLACATLNNGSIPCYYDDRNINGTLSLAPSHYPDSNSSIALILVGVVFMVTLIFCVASLIEIIISAIRSTSHSAADISAVSTVQGTPNPEGVSKTTFDQPIEKYIPNEDA